MEHQDSATADLLIIKEGCSLMIGEININVISYLGQLADEVHYFKASIKRPDTDERKRKICLFRIGSVDGILSREIEARGQLKDYKMVSNLFFFETSPGSKIDLQLLPDIRAERSSEDVVSLFWIQDLSQKRTS
jgi:hypothetical protein